MKKVLITGAAGFIGNKTALKFYEEGYEVVGIDKCENIELFPIYSIDMFDKDKVENILKKVRPDIIIRCAGSANVADSVKYPDKDFAGNVVITHNLLFAMHKLEMESTRLVFLSSAAVYGNPESLPINEEMPTNPLSPYALHKVMCEDLCRYFIKIHGMDIKIARIFSAYGRGLRKQIFWDMYCRYKNTSRLDMLGTGSESRDYIHVDDLIDALMLLANTDSSDVVFNVANGKGITISNAVRLFAEAMSVPEDKISFNGVARECDPLNWEADITKISKLGYCGKVSMQQGLTDYVDWVKNIES
jgi:nucleoside-diphosphate-sugar epimerase